MTDLLSQTLVKSRFCRLGFENASGMNILNQQRFKRSLRVRPLARHLLLKISSDLSFTLNHAIPQSAVNPINRLTASENITFLYESLRGEKPRRVFIYSYQSQHPRKIKLIHSELLPKCLRVCSGIQFLCQFETLFTPLYGVRDSPVEAIRDFQNLDVGISRGFMGQYFQVTGDTS